MWLQVLVSTLLAVAASQPQSQARPQPQPQLQPGRLTLLTWNLRYASLLPPHAWWQRRGRAIACLKAQAPDLIATQEGLPRQLADLRRALPGWTLLGRGREADGGGEQTAVLVRQDRFDTLEVRHTWLSPRPEVPGSLGYGNGLPRMVTRVLLRDKTTGQRLYLLDTHLDHLSRPARAKAARQLAAEIAALPPDVPVVLAGDFNALPGSPVHARLLAAGLRDAWQVRGKGPGGTFHGFAGPGPQNPRIDWVLVRGLQVLAAEVLPCADRPPWPSDHAAVRVVLQLDRPPPRRASRK